MDWVNVITVIGGTVAFLIPVTVVIKNTLDIIEKVQTMKEKRKAKKEQKESKQNKRPVVRRNLPRNKRTTRR
ncbi:hypothetical protein [Bacillus paramycoides]|uniref:hypothetical protein n=1 Tax=Bacillus paramycoides TaxID=2026194 RepID=UPI003CFF195B